MTGPPLCRNRKGYEHAITFRSKLTHVSPVWYQLRRDKSPSHSGTNGFFLLGGHEVNRTWVNELRTPAKEVSSGDRLDKMTMENLHVALTTLTE